MDERQSQRDDRLRQGGGQEGPASEESVGATRAPGEATGDARSPGVPEAHQEAPPRTTVRFSRKRVLVLGGVVLAGAVGALAGVKALGGSAGSAVSSVGEAVKDKFGPFPVRSVDEIDETPISSWTVQIDGLVDTPLTVDHRVWTTLPRLTETVDFHCVEGWSVDDVQWGGVAPGVLLDKAGVQAEARYVVVHAESGVYLSTLPLELMLDPQTVLADTLAGEPLPLKHGGPLRLVVPKQLGYKNVKWVSRLEVTDTPRAGYWESRGYPEDAPVGHG